MKKMRMQSTAFAIFAGASLCAANLSADTLGFWDFRDGAPGASVSEVKSSNEKFTGTAGTSKNGGSLPTFASDSPGRLIVSSRDATELSAAPQSVAFRYPDRANRQSGLIDIGGIADELVGKGSFTIELFVKMDETYRYWMEGDGKYDQISKTVLYLEALKDVGGFKMIAPNKVIDSGDAAGHAQGFAFEVYGRTSEAATVAWKAYNSTGDISDGKWHHLAVVYRETDGAARTGTLSFYVDYGIIGSPIPYANTGSADTGLKFRLGTGYKDAKGAEKTDVEPINASLAALRVSSGALAVEDFEVVDEKGKAVFAIGFNKEPVQDGEKIGTSKGDVKDLAVYSGAGLSPSVRIDYGLHPEAFPQYDVAKSRTNRRVRWGGKKMWTNLAGCHFLGYSSLVEGTENRQFAGTALCVAGASDVRQSPPSWTMEAFVRAEYDQTMGDGNGALLFGKSATDEFKTSGQDYPRYCWMLTRTKASDGSKLRLSWTEVAENGTYTADSEKKVETDANCLGDRKWHHVALSYDRPSRIFTLYVDYQSVLTQTVGETGLLDNLRGSYYFSRLACSAGFEGWMDEIRFTNEALKPEAFETLDQAGFAVIFR